MTRRKLVAVIDDDESVRESLPDLLRSMGFDAEAFPSAEAFLKSPWLHKTDCLILDVVMPGMSGPELQQELLRREHNVPIVFITAHAAECIRPLVVRRGAVAYLLKPFSEEAIISALHVAFSQNGSSCDHGQLPIEQ